MGEKLLSLDFLPSNSTVKVVGSHKYARLFKKAGYEVLSISHFLNVSRFIGGLSEDNELIRNWYKGVQINEEGILFYTPFSLIPYLNFPLLDNLGIAHNCLKFCLPSLEKTLATNDFLNPDILFIQNIRLISVLKYVKPKITVFRNSDRIESFKNMPKTIVELQSEVIEMSDLVFATSKNLQREASTINKNSFYLPNGVNSDFVMTTDEQHPYPDEYPSNKSPIIVYVGAISDWFDYDLYEYGLKNLHNISFVIIGPVSRLNFKEHSTKLESLAKKYNNFYYLGPKPFSELKKYLFHADIGVIPFTINSLTNEINPVKLFEYAAYGLPIVASSMSELQNYSEHVFLYQDKKGYCNALLDALNRKKQSKEKLLQFARNNTWEKRFEDMLSKLQNYSV